ncbi:MAG TPA: ABC transporter ATP-binding protein [Bacillota bacterium]|nr:ABC transporter ATP-binding protein [Bacillota bacterium]
MGFCLRTNHLTKRYGEKTVVNDLNMNIRTGDIYGFLGQNGAGKTTTLRMIMGLVRPSEGEIDLFGAGLNSDRGRTLERIGAIIEYPGFYLNLSAVENLEIHRRLMGMGNQECIDEALNTVGLLEAKHQKVKHYSLGMKQRLGIARALLQHPEFLVLDEPVNGLDPVGIKEVRRLFLDLARRRGITFLISSHLLSEIEQVATRIGIIHQGRLLEEIDYETLQKKTRRYLEIKVDDGQRAAYILEQKLGLTDYLVAGSGALRLYECLEQPAQVNFTLAQNGIGVKEIVLSGDSLEDYFLKITGGDQSTGGDSLV